MLLKNLEWKCTYSPADGNLIQKFYIPLLKCARTYDRTTGFYSARTLAAASAGVEALVKMAAKCGCLPVAPWKGRKLRP